MICFKDFEAVWSMPRKVSVEYPGAIYHVELVMGHGRIAANTARAVDVESSEMILAPQILV